MDTAITTLKQRFSKPPAEQIEEDKKCTICWNDYEGNDGPVKLPCGHIFGEECILTWAQCTTPSGRYQGCPFCQAELLRPSLRSRASILVYLYEDVEHRVLGVYGGFWGLAFACGLEAGCMVFLQFPESEFCRIVGLGLKVCLHVFMMVRLVKVLGWKRALSIMPVLIAGEWLSGWQGTLLCTAVLILQEWLMGHGLGVAAG